MRWFPVALLSLASLVMAEVPLYSTCGGIGTIGGDGLVTPGLIGMLTGTLTNLIGTTLSGQQCRDICTDQGYAFMVFAQGIDVNLLVLNLDNTLGTCYCTDSGLDVKAVVEGADAMGNCDTAILNLIGVRAEYLVDNPLTFEGCYTSNPTAVSTFNVGSISECFDSCAGNTHVSLRAAGVTESCGLLGSLLGAVLGGRSGGSWQCSCSNSDPAGGMANCNSETSVTGTCGLLGGSQTKDFAWNVYSRDVLASDIPGAGLRRRFIGQGRSRVASEAYCPYPKLACKIPNFDNFECVDVATELESCGGCPAGNWHNGTVSGLDCTDLPGVALGGVSCISGECVASRCQRHYTLVNGKCIPNRR